MEHLFIVRHGDYDLNNGNLTEVGKQQMEDIARQMNDLVGDRAKHHYIASSPQLQAKQSANIIARKLGLAVDLNPILYTTDGGTLKERTKKEIFELMQNHQENDFMTLVTHYELAREFPGQFLNQNFASSMGILEVEKGRAVHIEVNTGNYQILTPQKF